MDFEDKVIGGVFGIVVISMIVLGFNCQRTELERSKVRGQMQSECLKAGNSPAECSVL